MITEKVIILHHEYEMGDGQVSELTMRKSTVNDRLDATRLVMIDATQADVELHLFSLLCGVPVQDLEQLYDEDYDKIQEGYLFLKKQRPDKKEPPMVQAAGKVQEKSEGK